jgi:hypothetical protein
MRAGWPGLPGSLLVTLTQVHFSARVKEIGGLWEGESNAYSIGSPRNRVSPSEKSLARPRELSGKVGPVAEPSPVRYSV